MSQGELISWYIEEIDDLDTEEEVLERQKILTAVIRKLVVRENVCFPFFSCSETPHVMFCSLAESKGGKRVAQILLVAREPNEGETVEDRILTVHPNYVLPDSF